MGRQKNAFHISFFLLPHSCGYFYLEALSELKKPPYSSKTLIRGRQLFGSEIINVNKKIRFLSVCFNATIFGSLKIFIS